MPATMMPLLPSIFSCAGMRLPSAMSETQLIFILCRIQHEKSNG